MSVALLQFDGDRGRLRKELKEGSLYDVVQHIDFERSKPQGQNRIISAYWLNGCVDEALELLALAEYPWSFYSYLPIATGDTSLLRALANRSEIGEYHSRRLLAFAHALENHEATEEVLQEFLDYSNMQREDADSRETTDGPGLSYVLALIRGEVPELNVSALTFDTEHELREVTMMRLSSYVAWASVSVHCGLVPLTFRSLNSFMRPFAQKPRDFSRQAMSGDGAGYRTR